MRVHLEQEDTQEKQKYEELKAQQVVLNDNAWKVAEKIVRRHYTLDDVEKAWYLQNKFENVSTIAKDSCFHFHYLGEKETRDYDNNVVMEKATIEKHFDFRLNGSIDTGNNSSYSRDNDYGYALFRDELKAQDNCNPDILIEQEGKDNNPHKTKYVDNNNKYLGSDDSGYGKEWNEKYQLDLIGRDYCRDRSIACTELGLNITDHEIIRTNSTGLVIYNPKNLAERIKGMKNKNVSRADKIKARLLYEKQQQNSLN